MKVYDFPGAPNPKKLRVYLAEKGIKVPIETVDIVSGKNRTPEFLRKNPLGGLPVLELDDGSCLTESLAIIEYFEELNPSRRWSAARRSSGRAHASSSGSARSACSPA